MHNTAAIIPIKGGFIPTPSVSSTSRKNADNKCSAHKEDVSRQGTLQCECGCPCYNKREEPSVIDCFIMTVIMFVGLIWSGFCLFKLAGYLYELFDKKPDKK